MPQSPLQYRTPVSKLRCTLARSLGFSREFNSRNIEHYWYPCWGYTLAALIADIPHLIVAPQFPLWFVDDEEEEEVEEEEDGADLDEDENARSDLEDTDSDGSAPDYFEEPEVGNASFSSGTTIPQKNARSRFVDYAIVRDAATSCELGSRYAGWRISQEHVAVLVEEKRYPSRSLAEDKLRSGLHVRLEEACLGLKIQAGHLFRKYPGTNSVIAIAASGPYWSYTTISRKHFLSDEDFSDTFKTRDYTLLEDRTKNLRWTPPLLLDTTKSNTRFQAIYNQLHDLPGLEG